VRGSLFHFTTNKEPLTLPEGVGPVITLSEKLFVPVKDHPEVSESSNDNKYSTVSISVPAPVQTFFLLPWVQVLMLPWLHDCGVQSCIQHKLKS